MTLEQFNTAKILMERYDFVQKSMAMLVEINDFKSKETKKVVEAMVSNYITELKDLQEQFDEL
jgi:hypothetical protein